MKKTKEEKQKLVERRQQKFYDELVPYVEKYGRDMMRDFFNYWTELTPSRTKMRFELEPTWETAKRLAFWARNGKKWKYEKRYIADTREERLRDYAEVAASFRRRAGLTQ